MRSDEELPHSYKFFVCNEEFIQSEENWFRLNEIWRSVLIGKRAFWKDELIKRNCASVKYVPGKSAVK